MPCAELMFHILWLGWSGWSKGGRCEVEDICGYVILGLIAEGHLGQAQGHLSRCLAFFCLSQDCPSLQHVSYFYSLNT